MVSDNRDRVLDCCSFKSYGDLVNLTTRPINSRTPAEKEVTVNLYWRVFVTVIEPMWWTANMGFPKEET